MFSHATSTAGSNVAFAGNGTLVVDQVKFTGDTTSTALEFSCGTDVRFADAAASCDKLEATITPAGNATVTFRHGHTRSTVLGVHVRAI